jgi:hypothetical protein
MKWAVLIIFTIVSTANAYETITHRKFSNDSINISNLVQDPELLMSLGLILDANVNEDYFPSHVPADPNGADPNEPVFLEKTNIVRILIGGAVLEDAGSRSVHHFFDPQNGNVGGKVGHRSPDWALESIVTPNGGDEIRVTLPEQDYSYQDAQEYFYHALSLPYESDRRINFGLMFRSLGHVIHHLQDMAQPQHVRSDAHCDATTDFPGPAQLCFLFNFHNPSYYENYTNTRINDLSVLPISIPQFKTARSYWENTNESGIAQYTSKNFVSAGTNYFGNNVDMLASHPAFSNPVPLPEVITVDLADLLGGSEQTLLERLRCNIIECRIDFIQNQVVDNQIAASTINTRSSTLSIFDAELTARNVQQTYNFLPPSNRLTSLNRFNFDSVYSYLLPRAIAYSTGLLNHFFRGRIDIESVGWFTDSSMMILAKNISATGNSFEDGRFEIYYDSADGVRKPVHEVTLVEGSMKMNVGDEQTLVAEYPDDLSEDSDNPFVLVFNGLDGKVGEESGIATTRFSRPPLGKVENLVRLGGECSGKLLTVRIFFEEQPQNDGRVSIQGGDSNRQFNFGDIPEGIEVIVGDSLYYHGIDTASGSYLYLVSNRIPKEGHNPCTSRDLGPWTEGEIVKAISPGFNVP